MSIKVRYFNDVAVEFIRPNYAYNASLLQKKHGFIKGSNCKRWLFNRCDTHLPYCGKDLFFDL